jgi:hypothetical protein
VAKIRRWLPLAVSAALVIVMAAGAVYEWRQAQSLRAQLSSERAIVANQADSLVGANASSQQLQAQIDSLQAANSTLKGQVATLTSQNATLTNQIASLNAQFPPPVSCTADPGVRANVNQMSLQIVGESTTQAVINYLCQNLDPSPASVRLFFDSESLADLRARFGYG